MALDSDNVKAITKLVSAFRDDLAALHDPQTSEAVVRQEYIDPFWTGSRLGHGQRRATARTPRKTC